MAIGVRIEREYQCRDCGTHHPRYKSTCVGCGLPGKLVPIKAQVVGTQRRLTPYSRIGEEVYEEPKRLRVDVPGVDWVMNGGIPQGISIVIGGIPGCGKTTLCTQIIGKWTYGPALYASGEESKAQVSVRFARCGFPSLPHGNVIETKDVDTIVAAADEVRASLVIVDSIQRVYSLKYEGNPGAPTQIRMCGEELRTRLCRDGGRTLIIISQVNKDDTINGPRDLEHMGDVVLMMEGGKRTPRKRLAVDKTRFGPPDRFARLLMTGTGLVDDTPTAPDADGQEKNRRAGKTADAPYGPAPESDAVEKPKARRKRG